MLKDCAAKLDAAPVPTENRFIWPYGIIPVDLRWQFKETEPMETTTVTTTEKTERTAEDIIQSLTDGTYFTRCTGYLVSRGDCWSSALKIAANPNHRNKEIYLRSETLEELSQLSDLLKAHEDKRDTDSEIRYTVELLNKKGE